MVESILLIAPEAVSFRVAEMLRLELLHHPLDVAANRRAGLAMLRRGEYALVLLDESIGLVDEDGAEALYQNAGAAVVLEFNFGIIGLMRVLRQVKSALARRTHDQQQARASVRAMLQSELSASLSGLLLESQLALREATGSQAIKLRHVVELAGEMRDRLRAG